MRILDCTLRDGGYYTNWDFPKSFVNEYIAAINRLPIDYIEVGYRNMPQNEYLGQFGYSPVSTLKEIRKTCTKKVAIMLNEKDTEEEKLPYLIDSIRECIDMVRIAVAPQNYNRAVQLAQKIKNRGLAVSFNLMYLSEWKDLDFDIKSIRDCEGIIDVLCMVDSYGSMSPDNICKVINEIKEISTIPIGFHGHDNLSLALANSLAAIESGASYVDCTFSGMGRGAGNLRTELLLTYLNSRQKLDLDFNILSQLMTAISPIKSTYDWGTNLPYMISGANRMPQKDVMGLFSTRIYSLNNIVKILGERRSKQKSTNNTYPPFRIEKSFSSEALIVGGGESVAFHIDAIYKFLERHTDCTLILATARYADLFNKINNKKVYCIVGSESSRLIEKLGHDLNNSICVLPPAPRLIQTDVPDSLSHLFQELQEIDFIRGCNDSVTAIAIQTAKLIAKNVYIVGYDGYKNKVLNEKEIFLNTENSKIFQSYLQENNGTGLISFFPTLYKELNVKSIYQFL